jgi:hypothetical protein
MEATPMTRLLARVVFLVIAVALTAPVIRADVKTTEKTSTKLEGMLGRLMRGSGDGITSNVAVKGDRKLSVNDTSGEIIDLAEQKVYRLDVKKKEYRVLTFDQVREEWKKMQAEAEKSAKQLQEAQRDNPSATTGATLEFSAAVKETGQRKTIAGYEAREVVVTITGVQAGKTLEEGGGSVMTNTMWLGPKIPSLDEINAFDMKYYKAIIGDDAGAQALQQMQTVFAMFPSVKPMMETMQAEGRKLQGTPLASTSVMETVKSAEEMKAAGDQQSSGGGGSAACWRAGWPDGGQQNTTLDDLHDDARAPDRGHVRERR